MLHRLRLARYALASLQRSAAQNRGFSSSVGVAQTRNSFRVGIQYLVGAGTAWWAATSQSHWQDVQLGVMVPLRLMRDVATAAAIVADYKISLQSSDSEQREEVLHACHQRSADRLLHLCMQNGGIYIKLGQHIGQLDHLLPEEYVSTMRAHLLDKCPVSSYPEVRDIIRQDLGKLPEELFAAFEPHPIASASLAQVHVAYTASGDKLAVKVQHAGLREMSTADLLTIEVLVKAVKYVFPEFDYEWLVDEAQLNLPRELDFLHEARNAERCRANLDAPTSSVSGRVKVPEILAGLTSHRVLTMEFVEGVGVTDLEGLQRLGVCAREVARLVSTTFNEMIFIHGDVHCDPHAANLRVRVKDGKPQLVLLDHGLYKVLDPAFRCRYAALWKALVLADEKGIREQSQHMNAGAVYPLFAAMLTHKPWEQILDAREDHLTLSTSSEARQELQTHAAAFMKEITELLGKIPRPLILLLKTNDCLRAVDFELGQPANTIMIVARTANRALTRAQLEQQPLNPLQYLRAAAQMVQMEVHILLLRLLTWWSQHKQAVASAVPHALLPA